MTRRRRLRRRLPWAGVLLGLSLLLATVSALRVVIWTGHRMTSLTRPGRMENAMFGKTSLAIVATLGALLLAAPASADNRGLDRSDDGAMTAMLDTRERSFDVEQVASPSPDWLERFAAAHSLRERLVDDRFRIDPTNTAAPDSSSREIGWPQIGVALAFGLLLALGLVLAVRITDRRLPVAP